MEALTGATVAALTVYDMCKALSHAIVIGPAKLLGKRGGKRDFGDGADAMTRVTVLYFASLRDAAGVAIGAGRRRRADLRALYAELRRATDSRCRSSACGWRSTARSRTGTTRCATAARSPSFRR